MPRGLGEKRRTLKYIDKHLDAEEIFTVLVNSEGWNYKTNREFYAVRDKALVALIYVLALRISEALRLTKNQFKRKKDFVEVQKIKLSKTSKKGKPRKHIYRTVAYLPLKGERVKFTRLILDYLQYLDLKEKLFKFTTARAWQIVTALMGVPCHWFRAYGEYFLYDNWDKDIIAVSDYIKVDTNTLTEYLRESYKRYKPV